MSRFDRRLKGVETNSNSARPGTASCSLPASSVPSRGMLGGMLYNNSNTLLTRQNRQNTTQNRRIPQQNRRIPQQNSRIPQQQSSRTVNGVAVLKDHDDKIKRLEQRLEDLERNYIENLSRMEVNIQQKDKLFNLMTGDYKEEMKKMRDYIKSLHQKMKAIDQIKIPEKQVKETENVLEEVNQTKEKQVEKEETDQDQTEEKEVEEQEELQNEEEEPSNDKPNNNITLEVVEST